MLPLYAADAHQDFYMRIAMRISAYADHPHEPHGSATAWPSLNYTPVSTTGHRCTNSTGDDNDMDREVKPNRSSGAHVERGGNLARELGGREQGDWKTWPKYRLVQLKLFKRHLQFK